MTKHEIKNQKVDLPITKIQHPAIEILMLDSSDPRHLSPGPVRATEQSPVRSAGLFDDPKCTVPRKGSPMKCARPRHGTSVHHPQPRRSLFFFTQRPGGPESGKLKAKSGKLYAIRDTLTGSYSGRVFCAILGCVV